MRRASKPVEPSIKQQTCNILANKGVRVVARIHDALITTLPSPHGVVEEVLMTRSEMSPKLTFCEGRSWRVAAKRGIAGSPCA